MWDCQICRVAFVRETFEEHLSSNHIRPVTGPLTVFNCSYCTYRGESFQGIAEHCRVNPGHRPTRVSKGPEYEKYYERLFETLEDAFKIPPTTKEVNRGSFPFGKKLGKYFPQLINLSERRAGGDDRRNAPIVQNEPGAQKLAPGLQQRQQSPIFSPGLAHSGQQINAKQKSSQSIVGQLESIFGSNQSGFPSSAQIQTGRSQQLNSFMNSRCHQKLQHPHSDGQSQDENCYDSFTATNVDRTKSSPNYHHSDSSSLLNDAFGSTDSLLLATTNDTIKIDQNSDHQVKNSNPPKIQLSSLTSDHNESNASGTDQTIKEKQEVEEKVSDRHTTRITSSQTEIDCSKNSSPKEAAAGCSLEFLESELMSCSTATVDETSSILTHDFLLGLGRDQPQRQLLSTSEVSFESDTEPPAAAFQITKKVSDEIRNNESLHTTGSNRQFKIEHDRESWKTENEEEDSVPSVSDFIRRPTARLPSRPSQLLSNTSSATIPESSVNETFEDDNDDRSTSEDSTNSATMSSTTSSLRSVPGDRYASNFPFLPPQPRYKSGRKSVSFQDKAEIREFTDTDFANAAKEDNESDRYSPTTCSDRVSSPIPMRTPAGGSLLYQCPICRKCSEQLAEARLHLKKAHHQSEAVPDNNDKTGSTTEKTFECETCAKVFQKQDQLKAHQVTHTGERPFPCPQCPKYFRTKGDCRKHRLTHSTERPFSCAECDKRFRIAANLRSHEQWMGHNRSRRQKAVDESESRRSCLVENEGAAGNEEQTE